MAASKSILDLSGSWQVTWSEGMHGSDGQHLYPSGDPARHLTFQLPAEFHTELRRFGLVGDPNLGLNCLAQRWVEEQVWFCRRTFDAPREALRSPAWLVFERIDLNAAFVLNGVEVSRHGNAHRPCRLDVTGKLKPGRNELAIRLESGLHGAAGKTDAYSGGLDARLSKRPWLRKAQYQCGWDWSPRLINVGIPGAMRLEWGSPRLEQVQVACEPAGDLKSACIKARIFVLNGGKPGKIRLELRCAGVSVVSKVEIPSGISCQNLQLEIQNPELWWPRGHGGQKLYQTEVVLSDTSDRSDTSDVFKCRVGVRKVRLEQPAHETAGKYFLLTVNGRRIFCKGGNWVPPDLIPSEVSRGRLKRLVNLACESNYNLLRIWGGGNYAGHDLLELCDQEGLLVWHDLPFACSTYPADDAAFMKDVQKELRWAFREFAHHASLAVWCGNNELDQGYNWSYRPGGEWGEWDKTLVDHGLFHLAIPMLADEEDPHRPYWPSSPYSGEGRLMSDDPTIGDQHPWEVSLGPAGPDFWAYRKRVDRFPNEGGYLGAGNPATLKQSLGEGFNFRSPAWEHHDNAINFWGSGPGVCYQAVDFWLGKKAAKMPLERYLYASGLLQAEALSEYISNFRRRMFSSASAVYWMFNDSWPTVHGWTTFDYYLRKKLSFHPVRRAFAPVSVFVAEEGQDVKVFGVNDGPEDWQGTLETGLFPLVGKIKEAISEGVVLPGNASTVLQSIPKSKLVKAGGARTGAFARLADGRGNLVGQSRLFMERFRDLRFDRKPKILVKMGKGRAVFSSDSFVWGLALDLDGEGSAADNCFDLLPGREYDLPWVKAGQRPRILATGNQLI
jgi:beta-mannosidase